MSAFVIYTTEKIAIIVNDTLVYKVREGEITPIFYTNKTLYFAQYKTCAVCLGYTKLGRDLERFFCEHALVYDVDSFVKMAQVDFLNFINLDNYPLRDSIDGGHLGSINILGYSETDKCLKHFELEVDRDKISVVVKEMNDRLVTRPIMKTDIAETDILKAESIDEYCIGFVKQMHKESLNDELKTKGIAIGGSIIMTLISLEPSFTICITVPHTFDNFQSEFRGIIRRAVDQAGIDFKAVLKDD